MEFSFDNKSQNNRVTEVPLIKNEKNNTKNIIVTILSAEFPLKVRDLFETISEKYKKEITIQGVYKAVKQLEKQKIVDQVNDGYLLSLGWINKFNKYASDLLVIYSANK